MKRREIAQFLMLTGALPAYAGTDTPLRPVIPMGLVGSFAEGWSERSLLLQTVDYSLSYLNKKSSQRDYPAAGLSHREVKGALTLFREQMLLSATPLEFELRIWHYFDFLQAIGQQGRGDVLFTGYYEPIFAGSLTQTEQFRYPLYLLPSDLVLDRQGKALGRRTPQGRVPYYTRQEIEEGQLLQGQELVWLDNLLDAYLVQVQGSARIQLADGRMIGIGYAGKTDRAYQSLGKALIASGRLQAGEVNLPTLRQYFQTYPTELKPYLYVNESYVFFRETQLKGPGPAGSIGVPLTPMYSIATDRGLFPRGALAMVNVPIPQVGTNATTLLSRFVCNQDTGGAIIGAGRVDIYVGTGPTAEDVAGRLKQTGGLYFPIVKPNVQPFEFIN